MILIVKNGFNIRGTHDVRHILNAVPLKFLIVTSGVPECSVECSAHRPTSSEEWSLAFVHVRSPSLLLF